MKVDLMLGGVGGNGVDLIVSQIEDLQSREVVQKARVQPRNVVGAQVQEDQISEAVEDARLDPVLVEAVARESEDLQKRVTKFSQIIGTHKDSGKKRFDLQCAERSNFENQMTFRSFRVLKVQLE